MNIIVFISLCLCGLCSGDYLIRTRRVNVTSKMPTKQLAADSSLEVATLKVSPYVTQQPDGSYVGFVPDLLKALSEVNGSLPSNYTIHLEENDTDVGGRIDNIWKGIAGDALFHGYVHMSIGPILDSRDFNTFMPKGFSTPWTDVKMLLVVATSLKVGTLNEAFKQGFEFAVVEDSIEDKALAIEYNMSTFGQFLKANSRQVSKVKNIQDGLRDVASGKKALILNNLDVSLNPTSGVCAVQGSFMLDRSFAVAIYPGFKDYKDALNRGLFSLNETGALANLKQKWWGSPNFCSGPVSSSSSNIGLAQILTVLIFGTLLGSM